MADVLASFPNSRIKPRNATSEAQTKRAIVNANGEAPGTVLPDGGVVTANGNTLVLPANQNQTYINVRNEDKNNRVYYSYSDKADIVNGQQLDAGSFLEPGEAFDMEARSGVYMRSENASRINVVIDYGQG